MFKIINIKRDRKLLLYIKYLITWLFLSIQLTAFGIELYDLRCEYRIEPTGIDNDHPTFTFKLKSDEASVYLSKILFQLALDSTFENLIWDHKLVSNEPLIKYRGPALFPDTRYYYRIKVETVDGNLSKSTISHFKTGIKANFLASEWITSPGWHNEVEASYFRFNFNVPSNVAQASLYIVSGGPHEYHINGNRSFAQYLNPVFMDYSKVIPYNSYDITDQVIKGTNILGLILGNGWYNFHESTSWKFNEAEWRGRPKVKFLIVVTDIDGKKTYYYSKGENTIFNSGIITYNSIYTGEIHRFDSTLVNWSTINFDASDWGPVEKTGINTIIESQQVDPIVLADTIRPVSVQKFDEKNYIVTFPFNFSGILELKINGKAGQIISIVYGERYDSYNKQVLNDNLSMHLKEDKAQTKFQEDQIVFKHSGDYNFINSFNYKGFKYVQIKSSQEISLDEESIRAYFVHSKLNQQSAFESDNQLFNTIYELTNRSYLSNFHGYPTDCPHREKNGWTGDGHLMTSVGLTNFDSHAYYRKWLGDHRYSQSVSGIIPNIVPTANWGYDEPMFDWTVSSVFTTWDLYLSTRDHEIIKENFHMMKQFLNYWNNKFKDDMIYGGLGDWQVVGKRADVGLTSSVFYNEACKVFSTMCLLVGEFELSNEYLQLSNNILGSINEKYFDSKNNYYGTGLFTEQSMVLHYDIVPYNVKKQVIDNFTKSLIKNGMKLNVGILGVKTLFSSLSNNENIDLAYKLLNTSEYPSFGYIINNGATSLMENLQYEGSNYTASQNHAYFGTVNDFFFQHLAGVGFSEMQADKNSITLKPKFPGELNNLHVRQELMNGQIEVNWARTNQYTVEFQVEIPPNTTADFYPPINSKTNLTYSNNVLSESELNQLSNYHYLKLPNGLYNFSIELNKSKESNEYPWEGAIIYQDGAVFYKSESQELPDYGRLSIYSIHGEILFQKEILGYNDQLTLLTEIISIIKKHKYIMISLVNYYNDDEEMLTLKIGLDKQ